jgi:hypothetical protein
VATDRANAFQQALVACYQDRGVDAVAIEGGGVRSDQNGVLSQEESAALAAGCRQELAGDGVINDGPPTDDELRDQYQRLVVMRRCLINEGYEIPELVSEAQFVADPTDQVHPLDSVLREDGAATMQKMQDKCDPL